MRKGGTTAKWMALTLAIVLLSCTAMSALAETDKQVNILIYHQWSEMVDWVDGFAKDVMAKYPNLHVDQELQKDGATLQVKYASGDDPEIVGGPQTQQYMDMGKYLDMSDFPILQRLDKLCRDIVYDIKSGATYKIPLCNRSGGLFYNKEIHEALGLSAPTTWDEFVNNMRVIKEKMPDVTPFYCYSQQHALAFIAFGAQMAEQGAVEVQRAMNVNDSDFLGFDAPGGYLENYAAKLMQLIDENLISYEVALNGTDDMSYEAFATNKTAYVVSGTFWYGGLKARFPDAEAKVALAPVPSIIEGNGPFTVAGPDSAISISATSENQEEIMQVIDMLFSDEYLASYSVARGAPSAFSGIESDWGMIASDVSYNLAHYPIITQFTPCTGFWLSDIGKLVQEMIVGEYTPAEFAAEFRSRWDSAYENATR